ncbi:hypothetical protein BVC93_14615 [Mycobacterium sp. MS1601]|uniref:hypothetical protein n=1 Tax=Mycobacterium sp. MS1601 TaxID=1936029 RepID=UPI0009790A2C|nr:hypothetical protein [Mycobacterium sp. MS1601]AQA03436.1 hypothetical protein BVC93_14615 [Mycobacterium sp. MS1601]
MRAILGTEALASGLLTRGELRWNYERVATDVYLPKEGERCIFDLAEAAWLWSGRSGIVTGRAAAALHGATGINVDTPVELLTGRRTSNPRLVARNVRFHDDEVQRRSSGMLVTTPARTAFDLGRHLERREAVRHLDALTAATGVSRIEVEKLADRYRGAAGTYQAVFAAHLMDGGAQSPQESMTRMALVDAGFPRPSTQILVCGGRQTAVTVALGWEQHRIGLTFAAAGKRLLAVPEWSRNNFLQLQGWINLYVSPTEAVQMTVDRARAAFRVRARRGY